MARLSRPSLLDGLMDLLRSPDVHVRRGKLKKEHGLSFFARNDEGDLVGMRVVIDPRNSAVVTIMVHELLHLYMARHYRIDLEFVDPLEEAIVEALSYELTSYLHKPENEKLFLKWVRAIEQRLS